MTEYNELLEKYRRYRSLSREMNNELVKNISRTAFESCGKKLGLWHKGTLVFENEDETSLLMDFCIYDHYENGENALARYLHAHPPLPGSDEAGVLEAQTKAFYSILQVEEAIPQIGIRVHDVLNDQRFLLMDVGMGNSAVPGLSLATRVIPFQQFAMTGGAALPVDSKELLEKIFHLLAPHRGDNKKFADLPRDLRTDLTASIVRLCLSNRASSRVQYQDVPGTVPAQSRPSPNPRIHRNAPCPCGSGHKYKKCCGKI